MDERKQFIEEWESGQESVAELCRVYGISRKTAYKWIERYQEHGVLGLEELSRAPLHHPQAMTAETVEALLELRRQRPRWGPKKLKKLLEDETGSRWPALSSIADLLQREGLSHGRRKRPRVPRYTQPLAHAQEPNQVWCVDFKGHFACGNGQRCDPLTVSDASSRYLLRCRAVEKADGPHVKAVFEAIFREYGLPEAIRSDNGPPFASAAPAGLSRLGLWWLRLGIRHERIVPGHPEQNGRHERMHATLKAETAQPPCQNLRQQQRAFVNFERDYNFVRPHEALDLRVPADLYRPSARRYPARLQEWSYPAGMLERIISHNGYLSWKGHRLFLSEVLAGENVGLLQIDEPRFEVHCGPLLVGWLNTHQLSFEANNPKPRRRRRPLPRR